MTDYEVNPNQDPPFWIYATVKRLTQNGASYWPKLSKWITDETLIQ